MRRGGEGGDWSSRKVWKTLAKEQEELRTLWSRARSDDVGEGKGRPLVASERGTAQSRRSSVRQSLERDPNSLLVTLATINLDEVSQQAHRRTR